MSPRERTYRWTWDLRSSPAELWPMVADTNRFDRDSGVPVVTVPDDDAGLPNGRMRVRLRQYGVPLAYVQEPFEWDEPNRFSVARTFESGPLGSLRVDAELIPSGTGTRLTYEVSATPRRSIFGPAIPIQVGRILHRRFDKTFRAYDKVAKHGELRIATGGAPRLAPGGAARLAAHRTALVERGIATGTTDRLVGVVRNGDDVRIARLRPYELADEWSVPRRATLEAFLVATRVGLLELHWEVLCPLCRVTKATTSHLGDVPDEVHCDTCQVDYRTNFASSVEVTFAPSPSVRDVSVGEHCVGNPMATPHVVRQHLVAGGASITIDGPTERGRYRLRYLGHRGSTYLRVADGAAPSAGLEVDANAWPDAEQEVAPGATISFRNAGADERLLLLERTAVGDQAVTVTDVITLQRFRDLFAGEVLRPDDQVSVGMLAVVFTDLCDSTQLYQQIGDAVAFGRVLDHFDVLMACIADEDGAVVKTIGDAVMAVFPRPAPAVRAVLEAERQVTEQTIGYDRPLSLRAGVHFGPCLAVSLNDRLDYFGSTVNMAARLEGLADGGQVVVSTSVHDDPEVQDLLAETGAAVEVEHLTATLKGFAEPLPMLRLSVSPSDRGDENDPRS